MDAARLAQILHEEFRRDNWGDIDPYLFGETELDDHGEDAESLRKVMERAAKRITEETK